MKKTASLILIIGFVLIAYGSYTLFLKPSKTTPSATPYTGKYINGNNTIYIYQDDDNKGYFVINNDIYGKGDIGKKISSSVNGVDYEFTVDNDTLNVKTSNIEINGSYNREKTLTLKEYYNEIYGDIDLLESHFNGIYKDDEMEVTMFQTKEDEVTAAIKSNGKTQIFKFTLNSIGQLNYLQGEDNHVITDHENSISYTFEGSTDFFQKELSLDKKITYKDVFELYINK